MIDDDHTTIIGHLEEKKDLHETVIEKKGMVSLHNALIAKNKRSPLNPVVIERLNFILEKMGELKSEQAKTSNYSVTGNMRLQLDELFNEFISLFKEDKIYGT